jgi:hypothetical protein
MPQEGMSGIPAIVNIDINSIYSVVGHSVAKATEWTMPDLVRIINEITEQAVKDGKEGTVVILDDLHLVDNIMQKYLFEFLQNKTLQSFRLHPQAFLMGAMNGKESAGMDGFLSAIIDRLAIYHTTFDKEYWYNNVGHGLHPMIASFTKSANDRYFLGANSVDGSSPSPRSWTELSQFIPAIEEAHQGSDFMEYLKMATEARVGREASIEFMKHAKLFQKFDFETVLNKKQASFTIPDDISDQILMAFIIRYVSTVEEMDYLIEVLNKHKDRRTFISILINEFELIYKNIESITDVGKKKAYNYLIQCITDEKKIDEDLLETFIQCMLDMQ